MATAQDVIKVASGEIGYVEQGGSHGNDGNITKYWAELDPSFQGQPWCAAFVSWVFKHAGKPLPAIDKSYGFTYCPDAVTWARRNGLWSESGHYAPGDVVLYDWGNNGVADHTGIIVSDDGHTIHTIEGNTSPDQAGDQTNGGEVCAKARQHGPQVMGAFQMSRLLTAAPQPAPQPHPAVRHNPFPAGSRYLRLTQPMTHGDDVRFVQWAGGCPVDGWFGNQTDHTVRLFQRYHGLVQDGIVGPITRAALAQVTH